MIETPAPAAIAVPAAAPGPRPAWTGTASTPIHLVVNDRAGSAKQLLGGQRQDRRLLGAHPLHWHRVHRPADLATIATWAARQARESGGLVVAVGGDGTINTVAQVCWQAGMPMGAMPSGTFNLFARQHGVATEPEGALQAIRQALDNNDCHPVQVGLVNGQVFLVNASMGLYPRLLAEREAATARFGRHRVVALVSGLRSLLVPRPAARYHLSWHDSAGQPAAVERVEASTLFIGNNALQLADVGLPDTETVGAGELQAVTLSAAASRLAQARLLWRAITASLGDEPLIKARSFTRLQVDRPDRHRAAPIRVAFDGERRWMQLPLRFAVGERPLWLVGGTPAPAPAPAVATSAFSAKPSTGATGLPAAAGHLS